MARDSEQQRSGTRRRKTSADLERTAAKPQPLTIERILPPVAIIASLVGIFFVYLTAFPVLVGGATPEEDAQEQVPSYIPEEPVYTGVPDSWVLSGTFTVGDEELDRQVKEFCDAFAGTDSSYEVAAQTVYNNIVWGIYEGRTESEKPVGPDWVQALARAYFSSASPAEGQVGVGDAYEFAAAISYCLRYFGYGQVYAMPTLNYDETGELAGSAVVVVVGNDSNIYVCDPAQGSLGWMLDLEGLDLLVDDIGQDLTEAEALGLTIYQSEEETDLVDGGTTGGYDDTGSYDSYDSGYDSSYDSY